LTPAEQDVLVSFMSNAAEMAERHGRILARLSELGLSLAEQVHERAAAAETPEQAANLGLAFHRISRTVRQTIALEAKLVRDAARAEREAERDDAVRRREALPRDEARIAERKAQVRDAVERVIWDEVEDDEEGEEYADYLTDLLEERLEMGGRANDFGLEPLETHIARFLNDFGLQGRILRADADEGGEEIEFDAAPPSAPWPPPDEQPSAPDSA
jgi:hypothetical protein